MRKSLLILCLLLEICFYGVANGQQAPPSVYVDYEKQEIAINNIILSNDSRFSDFVEVLGTYNRMLETYRYATFYFDEIGIVILVDKKLEIIEEINFQYIPILGQQGTIKAFQGNLLFNGVNLAEFQSIEQIMNHFPMIEFREVKDVLVTTQYSNFNLELVFTQDNELEVCAVRFY